MIETESSAKLTKTEKQIMAEMGRRGGKAAADRMTKQQRIDRAKKAVAAREAKRKAEK